MHIKIYPKIDAEQFMKNKEIMVLGGLFESTAQDYSTGIPGTRNTPVLKWLASNEDMQDLQKEIDKG